MGKIRRREEERERERRREEQEEEKEEGSLQRWSWKLGALASHSTLGDTLATQYDVVPLVDDVVPEAARREKESPRNYDLIAGGERLWRGGQRGGAPSPPS